ncbi:MAG: DUF1636 domain-containing protein [Rubellimicrobium sp.]|nr:DUF1636 domain-containing protein [Rubellimicrobium sp.]
MAALLHVCVTCRAGAPADPGAGDDRPVAGARLLDALLAAGAPAGVEIRPVRCLSACDHGCNLALSRPGAWSYVYGRLNEGDVPEILRGAALYAASADGIVPWRERPDIFRRQSIARIPPMEP